MKDYNLTKEEEKTRRNWCVSLLVLMIFEILTVGLIAIFFPMQYGADHLISPFIQAVTITPLITYFAYYCAYKKHGNTFLTVILIFSPLRVIYLSNTLYMIINSSQELINGHLDYLIFNTTSISILLLIEIYWFVLSLKLRKINLKIRKQIQQSTPAYIEALPILQDAKDLDDLKAKFSKIVKESPEITSAVVDAYDELEKRFI